MTGKGTDITEARQLIVDLYGCQTSCIDDVESIKNVIHMVCQCIGAGIAEECYHKFSPIGISAVAVITTSQSTPGLSMGMGRWEASWRVSPLESESLSGQLLCPLPAQRFTNHC